MSQAAAATALSLLFWGMIVGRFTGSRLVRRVDPIILLRVTFALALIGCLIHWLSPVLAISLVGLFLAGIGMSNLYPLTTTIGLQAAEFNSSAAGSAFAGHRNLDADCSTVFGVLTDLADIRLAFGVEPIFLLLASSPQGMAPGGLHAPPSTAEAYAI